MKIDREYFENVKWEYGEMEGQNLYKFEQIDENIGVYLGSWCDVFFELDTLERIGTVNESDVRCSRKDYFTATYSYGWDGSKKTKKEAVKTLCTRGEYLTARSLLLQEYKANR